jgi:mycofactocin system glycosyltransferase
MGATAGPVTAAERKTPGLVASPEPSGRAVDVASVAPYRLVPDRDTEILSGGRLLVGGSPRRVMRLTPAGAKAVRRWIGGEPVPHSGPGRRLADELVRKELMHPRHTARDLLPGEVTVVVPAHNPGGPLPTTPRPVRDVVIDDGSREPVAGATVRHPLARGAAAARNAGAALADTEWIAFLDDDTRPEPDWLDRLMPHFADPRVAAVAPRVRSERGTSTTARYDEVRSPLDMGDEPASVHPGGRLSYVPTAALVVRASALRAVGGFDEALDTGEDVDLVWRLTAAGWLVRYDPSAVVWHRPRGTWPALLKRRVVYGRSAAPLALRHGEAMAPVRASGWVVLPWVLAGAGFPVTGAAIGAANIALFSKALMKHGVPREDAVRMTVSGHVAVGRSLLDACARPWSPAAPALLAGSRNGRRVLTLIAARYAADWLRTRPDLDPARHILARAADDLAYAAGVWQGCVRHRTLRPLIPTLISRGKR